MTVEAIIIDVIPDTRHEGTTYEQIVVIQLCDGSTIGVFDKDMSVKEDIIGCQIQVQLSLLPSSKTLQISNEEEIGVRPNEESPEDYLSHEFIGVVQNIEDYSDKNYRIGLDVGVGTVLLFPFKRGNEKISVGQTLRIEASRTDLTSVEKA